MKERHLAKIYARARNEDGKTITEMGMKIGEEVGELFRAVLVKVGAHGTNYRKWADVDDKVLEEFADSLICLYALAAKMDIKVTDIERWIDIKYTKWGHALDLEEQAELNKAKNLLTMAAEKQQEAATAMQEFRTELWRATFGGVPEPDWYLVNVFNTFVEKGISVFTDRSPKYKLDDLMKGAENGYLRMRTTVLYFMPFDEDGDGAELWRGWADEQPDGEELEELWEEIANDGENPYDKDQLGFQNTFVLQIEVPET